MMKMQKLLSSALAGALLLGACPGALAAAEPGGKEEVVYINLDTAGAVDTVDVVNIFELAQPGQIVDHGAYSSVRNMTTTDPLAFDGETVTVNAGAGRLYYEGRLDQAEIPWLISLRYFMDGTEHPAEELAGMSGDLEIRMTVEKNPRCPGNFFDDYALQASFTLDGDRCADIVAEGATVANVGSDKQLTYTILPGRGADISVTAWVTDFTMDPVAINGVPLSLDVEVDDEALLGKVTELTDAVESLDEGAGALSGGMESLTQSLDGELRQAVDQVAGGAAALANGAGALQSGGASVDAGAYAVDAGAGQVNAGAAELSGGLAALEAGLGTLNSRSGELTSGSAEVLSALQRLRQAVDGVDLTQEDVDALGGALETVQTSAGEMAGQLSGAVTLLSGLGTIYSNYVSIAGSLAAAIDGIEGAAILKEGPAVDTSGLRAALTALENNNAAFADAVNGMSALGTLASTLSRDLTAVADIAGGLAGEVDLLPDALARLKEGVDGLEENYEMLDSGIQTYTQGVADAYAGSVELSDGADTLAQGAASLAAGAGQLHEGTGQLLRGIDTVIGGAGALSQGASALSGGTAALAEGAGQLDSGAEELAEGTAAMREATDGMDTKIGEQIDELLQGVTGGGGETVSFVSDQNRDVKAVQFVIRTPAIQPPVQPSPAPALEEESTLWDKLADLF